MKKQKKILVVAAIALMIALVSGMGVMTFARYITTSQVPTQQATAAKWGFVVTANTDNLFSTDYTLAQDATYATTVATNTGVAVNAFADTKLVAPGTSGSMTITISGQAEVRAKLTIAVGDDFKDISIPQGTDAAGADRAAYHPIKWTVTKKIGTNAATDVVRNGDVKAFLDAIADESTEIEAGDTHEVVYTISWAWDFNADDNAASINDTLIGLKSAPTSYADLSKVISPTSKSYQTLISETTYSAIKTTLMFDLSVTIAQIQEQE